MSAPQLRAYQAGQLDSIFDALEQGTNRVLIKSPTGTGKTVMFAAMLEYPRAKAWLDSLTACDCIAGGNPQKPKQHGADDHAKGCNALVYKQRGARMLVIAHREELLDQAAEKIQRANPGIMVSIEQGDRYANRYSDVVIASIQTLAAVKFRRLKALLRNHRFRIVIVDEAHHAAAASYRTALVHLGFLPPADATDEAELEAADFDDVAEMEAALAGWDAVAPKDRVLVGVTATPNRSDAIGLGCVFQTIAYSYALRDAINDGHLVPITPWVIETDAVLDEVRTTAGDFNQKDLAHAVNTSKRNQLAVAAWNEHAAGLPTLAFTVDVAHAHTLVDEFERAGVRARAISGETPKDDRRAILRAFTEGRLDLIANCMVLTEGTDLPLTRCILHAKPTKSATLYEQMTGRGLRPYPGKPDCIVLDLADVARRHSLMTAPVLYGLPPGLVTNGDELGTFQQKLEAFTEKNPTFDLEGALRDGRLTLEQLHARASTFDVWKIPTLGAYASAVSMNWILTGEETFRLQYPWQEGIETLLVQKDMLGHFEVTLTYRPLEQTTPPAPVRQRTVTAGLPTAIAALGIAEAFVQQERRSVSRLKDREAPWRARPASDKQLAVLRRLKAPHNPKGLTMGQASDLIDLANARRGSGPRLVRR